MPTEPEASSEHPASSAEPVSPWSECSTYSDLLPSDSHSLVPLPEVQLLAAISLPGLGAQGRQKPQTHGGRWDYEHDRHPCSLQAPGRWVEG